MRFAAVALAALAFTLVCRAVVAQPASQEAPDQWESSGVSSTWPHLDQEGCRRYGSRYGYSECGGFQPEARQTVKTNVKPQQGLLSKTAPKPAIERDAPSAAAIRDEAITAIPGHMLMIAFEGANTRDPGVREARRKLTGGVAGHVLFRAQNITTLEQTRALAAALGKGLTAVEFTAGQIGDGPRPVYPALADVGKTNEPHDAHQLYTRLAGELHGLGLWLNFAPVLGLDDNDCEASFGQTPLHAAAFAIAFAHGHRDAGVLTALGHCRLSQPSPALASTSEVYAEVIKRGVANAIVVAGENAVESIGVLKYQLGFKGLIIADFSEYKGNIGRDAVKALSSGADMIIVKSGGASDPAWRVFKALLRATKVGELSRERLRAIAAAIKAFEAKGKELREQLEQKQTAQRVGEGVAPR
jgi:hypothetical protein